ncbi:hypothetical protein ACLOJK_005387 [Asimina triloba]
MKTEWCAETATKAYIDTVKTLNPRGSFPSSNVADLVSAMAAGSKSQLIVEAWARGGDVAASVGLSIASRHTRGRHVCIVLDERSRLEYVEATRLAGVFPEMVVGEAEEAMGGLSGVDFVVVDCRRKDFAKVLRFAKMSPRGGVMVCKNAHQLAVPGFRWQSVLGSEARVTRAAFLPVGNGVEIAQVGFFAGAGNRGRWITHVDKKTGEEHVFRR